MANLVEEAVWDAGIRQIETTDPVIGGPPNPATGAGLSNIQAFQLARRTAWLRAQIEALVSEFAALAIGDVAGLTDALALLAPKASPALTGNPTGPTAAQFDADTSLANTAFVQRALGNFQTVVSSQAAAVALTQGQVGCLLYLSAAYSVTQAVTLPSGTGLPFGATFTLLRTTVAGLASVAAAAGQQIDSGSGLVSSVALRGGDTAVLTWNGAVWAMSGAAMQRVAGFANQHAASGWQRLPSGLIMQWGLTGNIAQGGTAAITFPIAFPTACQQVFVSSRTTTGNTLGYNVGSFDASTTGVTISNNSGTSGVVQARWIALGN